jgi:integrase
MARPLGSIRQRSDGTWEGRIRLPLTQPPALRRQHSVYAPTEREARQALARLISDESPSTRSAMTVGTWLDRWLADYTADVRATTRHKYAAVVRLYLRPELGARKLQALTAADVAAMQTRLRERGLAPGTIRQAQRVLGASLRVAQRQGLVRANVASLVDAPRSVVRIDPPTDAELMALIGAADRMPAPFGLLLRLAATMGLRQGEALGLTWADLDGELLTVQRSLNYGTDDVGDVKSRAGLRRLWLPADLVAGLRAERQRQLDLGRVPGWVFAQADGTPMHGRWVLRHFHAVCDAAGLRRYRWHDLRHAAITRQLAAGRSAAQVQGWAGHASISTTVGVYGHLQPQVLAPLSIGSGR